MPFSTVYSVISSFNWKNIANIFNRLFCFAFYFKSYQIQLENEISICLSQHAQNSRLKENLDKTIWKNFKSRVSIPFLRTGLEPMSLGFTLQFLENCVCEYFSNSSCWCVIFCLIKKREITK